MSCGRKKDPIWLYFVENITVDKKGCRATCKKCGKEMQGIVSRLKNHYSICLNEDKVVPQILQDNKVEVACSGVESDEKNAAGPSGLKRQSDLSSFDQVKKSKSSCLDNFIVKTSAAEKSMIDCQIAKYFYATNTSFRSVENQNFKKLVQMLRPGYVLPTKIDLSTNLLNKVYEEEMRKCSESLHNQTVCMTLDGWSNIHNQPIVCICVITMEGNVHLIDTIDTSGTPHTTDNLSNVAKTAILNAEEKFNCRIRSFVTDNANNMKSMRKQLQTTESLDVLCYGCSAHLFNLLAKDFELPNVIEHVTQIIKYFRNNHFARAKFNEKKGNNPGLSMPVETRWNTMCDALDSYVKNWSVMFQIVEENRENVDQNIRSKVINLGIKRNVEDLLLTLKPIAIALSKVERENCNIAEAVYIWKTLENDLKENNVMDKDTPTHKSFMKRYKQALTPAHFLAYLLSPIFPPEKLTPSEKDQAIDFVQCKYKGSSLLNILLKLVARTSPFNGPLFENEAFKDITVIQWWKSLSVLKECIGKTELEAIEQLLTAKATSAGVERMFSTFGLVQNKLRNQLGIEKAAKLVFLYRSLNKTDI